MNPLLPLMVGTGVGLSYELDLEEAITRAGITTGIAYAINTPVGRRSLMLGGAIGYTAVNDLVLTPAVAAMSTSTAGAIGTGLTYTGAAAAGVVIGAAVGTAVSSTIWGQEGKEKAIDFYTGQNTTLLDYVPHYNAYKIIKHYGSEIFD